jgi:hypothetical protein
MPFVMFAILVIWAIWYTDGLLGADSKPRPAISTHCSTQLILSLVAVQT